jgi:hypothetical protein
MRIFDFVIKTGPLANVQGVRMYTQIHFVQSRNFSPRNTQFSNGPIDQTMCQYNL